MLLNLIFAYSLNLLCYIHFFNQGGLDTSPTTKKLTYVALLFPIVGALIYAVWFIWIPPPPSDEELQQKSWNHYGKSSYTPPAKLIRKTGRYKYATQKKLKEQNEAEFDKESDEPNAFGKYLPAIARVMASIFGLILINHGAKAISAGALSYGNPWGQNVFAPTAIFTGCLIIYYAVFKWRKFLK